MTRIFFKPLARMKCRAISDGAVGRLCTGVVCWNVQWDLVVLIMSMIQLINYGVTAYLTCYSLSVYPTGTLAHMLHARNIYLHVYHQFKPNVGKIMANTAHLCRIQYGHQDSEVISDASFSMGFSWVKYRLLPPGLGWRSTCNWHDRLVDMTHLGDLWSWQSCPMESRIVSMIYS